MKTAVKDTIKTITTHYIDGAFVESHGREVINIIRPTDGQVIARVTLGESSLQTRVLVEALHEADLQLRKLAGGV